jgi:chromosome segregation ATPase
MMNWRRPARQRAKALDAEVVTLNDRLNLVSERLNELVNDVDRVSSGLERLEQLLHRAVSDGREQADRLAALRERVGELQSDGRSTVSVIAEVQQSSRAALEAIDSQASRLDQLQDTDAEQGRVLDQIRADVTRIEWQGAIDLAELRATDTALARVALRADAREAAPQA